jgi:hypothetical protein
MAKVSINDTTSDYLASKITGGDGITVTEMNDGSNETLDIDVELATNPGLEISSGALRAKIGARGIVRDANGLDLPTAGSAGDVLTSNGTVWAAAAQNFDHRSASSADSSTVGSSVSTENNMNASYAIPANDWSVGSLYRIQAAVVHKVASGTVTLRVKFGSTAIFTTAAISTSGTNTSIIDLYVTCRSTGGSGTVFVFGTHQTGSTLATSNNAATTPAATTTTIDTTASQTVQVSAQYSASDVAQGALVASLIVSKLSI